MYKKEFKRKSYGPTFNGGFRTGRPQFRRFSTNRQGPRQAYIDPNKFINKAQELTVLEQTIVNSFQDFNLDQDLLANILSKGFDKPMPIQDQAIPHLMAGKDLIGIANTGMGKTAAFLIPLIQKIIKNPSEKVLIITPTRELAEQIDDDFRSLSRGLNMYSVVAIGGVGINRQIRDLRRSYSLLIGTPGRLKDLASRRNINYSRFSNVVLDEVDRMFDMGFSKEIVVIMSNLPKERQSLFFSATITPAVEKLIRENSVNPVSISVKTRDTAASVDQDVIKISSSNTKIEVLHEILIQKEVTKTLIFGRTKHGVNRLADDLRDRGFKADCIHGNKSQGQRQKALAAFKSDRINILVATDVAARGLDIPNVSHVINYEVPATYDDYIHRIGRTGRANKVGKALTFI